MRPWVRLERPVGRASRNERKIVSQETELIGIQAMKIANLENVITALEDDRRSIRMIIYGCGGPLNDNVRAYTRDQMVTFAQIAEHVAE